MGRLKNYSSDSGCYFFTSKASGGRNLLQRAQWAELLESILFEYRDKGEYLVHQYVIMPDHFHLLATTARAERPARVMQLIKGRFSFELKRQFGGYRSPWQEGFASRRIRTVDQFRTAARYIEQNPVEAGLCESAERYQFSSSNGGRALDPMPEFGAEAPKKGELAV